MPVWLLIRQFDELMLILLIVQDQGKAQGPAGGNQVIVQNAIILDIEPHVYLSRTWDGFSAAQRSGREGS